MNEQERKPKASESSSHRIGDAIRYQVLVLLPGLLYFGAARQLGIWDDPAAAQTRVAGLVITYVLFGVVMDMGESMIEDIVKFLFFSLACALVWRDRSEQIRALLLAIPIGSGLPILMRVVVRGLRRERSG